MKLNRKWILVAALVMSVALATSGTLAYLTDTDGEENIFTMGDVNIRLNENFDQGATLLPGVEIEKTPSITNTGKNDAWVWATVAIPTGLDMTIGDCAKVLNVQRDETDSNWNWAYVQSLTIENESYNVYTVLYNEALIPGQTTTTLFNKVSLDEHVDIDPEGWFYHVLAGESTALDLQASDPKIYVNAYAIQKDDFADVATAYAAYMGQWSNNGNQITEAMILAGVNNNFENETEYGYVIYNVADLAKAAANGGSYMLSNDVELGNNDENNFIKVDNKDFNLNGNGNQITAGSATNYSNIIVGNSVATYSNVDIVSHGGGIGAADGAKVEFNSGSVSVDSPSTSGRYIFYAEGEGTEITINGGEFSWDPADNQKRAYIYAGAGTTVYVNGGTFGKASTRDGYTAGILGDGTVIITGGTFGFDPSMWVATGYEAVKDGETWTVTKIGATVVSSNDELDDAIADGATVIELGSGNYIIPDSAQGKKLIISGNGNTVIATQDDGSYEGCDYSLDGATVTFENITINTDSSTYTGYARLNATYNNCVINGTYTLYGDSEFNNCTFNVSGDVYNIWTWGAPTATFKNCTFNSDGKALLLYGQANTKLTVDGCTFNDKGGLDVEKAAIEIGNDYNKSYELIVNNTTVNGYAINGAGINTGSTLWANKNFMGTDKLNVVVDGVDVY